MKSFGIINFYYFYPTKKIFVCQAPNTLVYGAGQIYANALSDKDSGHIRIAIFEYKNLANPGDPISYPTLDKTRDVSYYLGLSSSPDTDIIRVPIVIEPGLSSSGGNYAGFNNITTFYAATTGTTGYFGKAFDSASNSTVYGVALAATDDISDLSKDIIFSASYGNDDLYLAKPTNAQISFTYPITHTID